MDCVSRNTGGTGTDSFMILSLSHSQVGAADRITDFSSAESDKIYLSDLDANTALEGDQAFSFIGLAEFSGIAGELRAVIESDGLTHIYGNTTADTAADFELIVTNDTAISAASFIL